MINYVRDSNSQIAEICKDALIYKSVKLSAWVAKMSLKNRFVMRLLSTYFASCTRDMPSFITPKDTGPPWQIQD